MCQRRATPSPSTLFLLFPVFPVGSILCNLGH
jgi:hypothetical protein